MLAPLHLLVLSATLAPICLLVPAPPCDGADDGEFLFFDANLKNDTRSRTYLVLAAAPVFFLYLLRAATIAGLRSFAGLLRVSGEDGEIFLRCELKITLVRN